jgi:AhpD family alkylhydroperoxidase
MSNRIDIKKIEPGAYKALLVLEDYIETTSLSPLQKEMIRVRASQLNGCAYCIDMHTRDARNAGESEHRLYTLSAWRETPFFTAEERAILSLTEEVTLISHGVSNETYLHAVNILGEQKTAQVIMNAIVINAWNRVGVSTRMVPKGNTVDVSNN